MSAQSLASRSEGSAHSSRARSPIYIGCTRPESMFAPELLERKLRNITPHPDDYVERWESEAKRDYDRLIALGGRPTRPIRLHFVWKISVVDGMFHYRDEDENKDVIQEVDMTSQDDGLAFSHWSKESIKWKEELERWQNFKEAQRLHHQLDRSETALELENTDAALVEALSRLNDWQEFEFIQQKKLHKAERFCEQSQQGITQLQNAVTAAGGAGSTRDIQEQIELWLWQVEKSTANLKASQEELAWVKSQWTEVLAETSGLLPAARNLQRQLEDKFKKQTHSIYRRLQNLGARPSHPVHLPKKNIAICHRLQHWIDESARFTAELWDWRVFMAWRPHFKNADIEKEDEQMRPSHSELFEDLVEYRKCELDKATSWVECWQCRVRQYKEAQENTSLHGGRQYRPADDQDDQDLIDARAYAYAQPKVTKVEQAQPYAKHAEEMVSVARKRLEQSKEELQSILAECGQRSKDGMSARVLEAKVPAPPPNRQPSTDLAKNRKSSKCSSAGKSHRRSKKMGVRRKARAGTTNINTEQQAIPSLDSDKVEKDHDIEMADAPKRLGLFKASSDHPPTHPPTPRRSERLKKVAG